MEDSPIEIYAPELNLLSPQYDFQFISNDNYPPLVRHLSDLRADYIAAGNNFGGAQTAPLDNFTLLPDGGSGIFRNQDLGLYLHINGKNGIFMIFSDCLSRNRHTIPINISSIQQGFNYYRNSTYII